MARHCGEGRYRPAMRRLVPALFLIHALIAGAPAAVHSGLSEDVGLLLADGTVIEVGKLEPRAALLTRDEADLSLPEESRELRELLTVEPRSHGVVELTRVDPDGSRGRSITVVMALEQAFWSTEAEDWMPLGYAQVGEQFAARTGGWIMTAREIKREPATFRQPALIHGEGVFVVLPGADAASALWAQDAGDD